MNAIGPAAAVAAPTNNTIDTAANIRASPTRCPSERATSSPNANAFRMRPDANAITVPTAMNGANCAAIVPSRPESEPTAQNRN